MNSELQSMNASCARPQNSSTAEEISNAVIVERFKSVYQRMGPLNVDRDSLFQLYDNSIVFEDSFHRIDGFNDLLSYFLNLYENVSAIGFVFHEDFLNKNDAMLTWTMTFAHPRLNKGHPIDVKGASHIIFDKKITYHRDYFDGGKLLYEHVPVLGMFIKKLKQRMV